MQRLEYVVEVWDSTRKVCEHRIPTGQITERNLETLVLLLAAKHGQLEDEEVIASLLKRNARAYQPLLEINKHASPDRFGWVCGENPHVAVKSNPVE